VALSIIFAVIVFVAILVAYINSRPASFRVEREAHVDAPPEIVFGLINDFHQWEKWSPYDKLDPNMKKSFDGPEAGPGASYAWEGNDKARQGRMTILDSKPVESVSIKLEFIKPFVATNQTTFELVPTEYGTKVAWMMEGQNSFTGKAFSVFKGMEEVLGKDFERGLFNLNKAAIEAKRRG
jgi:uncharacterized protein YndB with AHSA1/START domain